MLQNNVKFKKVIENIRKNIIFELLEAPGKSQMRLRLPHENLALGSNNGKRAEDESKWAREQARCRRIPARSPFATLGHAPKSAQGIHGQSWAPYSCARSAPQET